MDRREAMWQYVALSLLVGVLAGAINGFFVAYLRLQPIITTYATSFLYAGFALFILPNPGGGIPANIAELYRSTTPLGFAAGFLRDCHSAGALVVCALHALREITCLRWAAKHRQLMKPLCR